MSSENVGHWPENGLVLHEFRTFYLLRRFSSSRVCWEPLPRSEAKLAALAETQMSLLRELLAFCLGVMMMLALLALPGPEPRRMKKKRSIFIRQFHRFTFNNFWFLANFFICVPSAYPHFYNPAILHHIVWTNLEACIALSLNAYVWSSICSVALTLWHFWSANRTFSWFRLDFAHSARWSTYSIRK